MNAAPEVVVEYTLPPHSLPFRVVEWPDGDEDGPMWVLEKLTPDAMGVLRWEACGSGLFDERQREIARHIAAVVKREAT